MNIKIASALLVLSAALNAPAFAQSGIIHFQGRIVAPVCSGTPVADQSANAQPGTLSMDNTGCENNTGTLVASTKIAHNDAPALPAAFTPIRQANEQADAEPVLTITYH